MKNKNSSPDQIKLVLTLPLGPLYKGTGNFTYIMPCFIAPVPCVNRLHILTHKGQTNNRQMNEQTYKKTQIYKFINKGGIGPTGVCMDK
jgi:hypothetical protein